MANKFLIATAAGLTKEVQPVAADINVGSLSGDYTLQQTGEVLHSTGVISGGGITDDTDGTITVASGYGFIRAGDTRTSTMYFVAWSAESGAPVNLTDNSMNYIYLEYNGGSPQFVVSTTEKTDTNTNIYLGSLYKIGTDLHLNGNNAHVISDPIRQLLLRLIGTEPHFRESGAIVSDAGTRNLGITLGAFWQGLNRFTTPAIDTSAADTFLAYYRDGVGGWTEQTAQTVISNTLYDDGSGTLATIGNNKYAVYWIYTDQDGEAILIYGQDRYTLGDSQSVGSNATMPPQLEDHAILLAKVIVAKNDTTLTQILSSFRQVYARVSVGDHGELTGLADDDHTIYPLLVGRAGGQTQKGGTAASEDLTLSSTSHGTKGNIVLEDNAKAKTVTFNSEIDNGDSGAADTIDWKAGQKQKSTLTDDCTYTFTAPVGPCNVILKVVQDGTGSRLVTWPASVKWPAGTAPTLTTTPAGIDIISFYYDGTNYFGGAILAFA